MSIFTATPGYAGYFGPVTGNAAMISFGRGGTPGNRTGSTGTTIDDGFLCDSYTIDWSRPTQSKRFLNNPKPVAIVGYGNGTLAIRGLVGTYNGFEKFLGYNGNNRTSTQDDICNPLYCLIKSSNSYVKCNNGGTGANASGVDWDCYNLVLSNIRVTGQVQDNGVLFQQADVVFTMGGLKPVRK